MLIKFELHKLYGFYRFLSYQKKEKKKEEYKK